MLWGIWLICEELVDWFNGVVQKDYGYIFEVFVSVISMVEVKFFKVMGCFNYEVVCVDFVMGIVYLIEDMGDSLLYCFVLNEYGNLVNGG